MGLWRWLFGGHRFLLRTSLTPSQCVARLKLITAPSSVGASDQRRTLYHLPGDLYTQELTEQPLRGKISESGFRISRRIDVSAFSLGSVSSYRMLFATWVDGTFSAESSGTRVTIRTRVFRGVGCFWLVVLGMALLFTFATIGYPQSWPALAFPALFISLGVAAGFAARNDANFLLPLLKSTIDGSVTQAER